MIIILKLIVCAMVMTCTYMFGRYTGSVDTTEKLTRLCIREECDGCKKIKPVITTLEYDSRRSKITRINIGCSKALTCRGRKDKSE